MRLARHNWMRSLAQSDFLLSELSTLKPLIMRSANPIPPGLTSEQAAPLLCSGIVGYRALNRAMVPPGGRLGICGFGASAHLVAQIAVRQGAVVRVMTRSQRAQALALDLGAASASGAAEPPHAPLDAAILFAPVVTSSRR